MNIRVLIADDHKFYREGVIRLLSEHIDGIDVVAEAETGEQAVQRAGEMPLDVVLMDLAMPGAGGLAAIREIHFRYPKVAILVLSISEDDSVFSALRSGARGYVLKQASVIELGRAIQAVHGGEAIFSAAIADRLVNHFSRSTMETAEAFPQLSERERQVLDLLAGDVATVGIAQQLGLTQKTTRNYISNVLAKLQVGDRAEAVRRARDAGLGQT